MRTESQTITPLDEYKARIAELEAELAAKNKYIAQLFEARAEISRLQSIADSNATHGRVAEELCEKHVKEVLKLMSKLGKAQKRLNKLEAERDAAYNRGLERADEIVWQSDPEDDHETMQKISDGIRS